MFRWPIPLLSNFRGVWEVVDGYDGDSPYWTFVVEDRYFAGYSVVGFPVELAQHLGCEPNGRRRVALGYPGRMRTTLSKTGD